MIRVYLLPVYIIDGTETVAGVEIIHDAILRCTDLATVRELIMDTLESEHTALMAVAIDGRVASPAEIDLYNANVLIIPADPDFDRAKELLHMSPSVITQPEIWELLRIFGRFHGIRP